MQKRSRALLKAIATTVVAMMAAYAVASAAGHHLADIARSFKPAVSAQPKARPHSAPGERTGRP